MNEPIHSVVTDPRDIRYLIEAMWQLLDDMGKDGQTVCLAAKAQARVAFEPFRQLEHGEMDMTMEEARRILVEVEL